MTRLDSLSAMALAGALLLSSGAALAQSEPPLANSIVEASSVAGDLRLTIVPIPEDPQDSSERRARAQPDVPDGYAAVPFVESAPLPVLTRDERERGYLLFQRPSIDPVYPNTRPLAHERLQSLTGFATPGEFEPVTFSIYPVRDLENLRVRPSALTSPDGEIPVSNIDVRLLTYWNIGYPHYTSRSTYRRTPELLERVTVHSSPAAESQRWWITIHVPQDTAPGLYQGNVTLWDDGHDDAVAIPVALRVLGFELKADPAKHYSAYYDVRNQVQFKDRDEDFIQRATGNEYRSMVEHGLDMLPTFYLHHDRKSDRAVITHEEELDRMLAAGLGGPLPLLGGNDIEVMYLDSTPGGKRRSHWNINKMPPPGFYENVTEVYGTLKTEAEDKGWPELIVSPLDEVHPARKEFGAQVYQAVHDAGLRTYITKDPMAADAVEYQDAVDVWNSQPYSMHYERIVGQDRYDYWSYPNHNACEIKDPRVMSKGGRMTYGYGFWRSGYTTLIPWHWAWTPGSDQFDYLRGSASGCGQRIGDDAEVIPAVYWESFREGRDDARYVYSLQQAVWEREGCIDPECQGLLAEGKALLQELWDAIDVQPKYLVEGMWPSDEFDARRWRLAMAIEALLEYPAIREGTAPSVLVERTEGDSTRDTTDLMSQAIEEGRVIARDLGEGFSDWENQTGEGEITITADAGRDGDPGMRWRVKVDHKTDGGGEGGDDPVGWPRVARSFAEGELDMSGFDYLMFMIRIDSDRDEVADNTTPVGFTIHSSEFFEVTRDLGGRQRVWLPVLFDVRSMIETVGQGEEQWRDIGLVQIYISESDYADRTDLTFDVAEVSLLRFKAPTIQQVDVARFVTLPQSALPVSFRVAGLRSVHEGTHNVTVSLVDARGQSRTETTGDLASDGSLALDIAGLQPGAHTMRLLITTADGQLVAQAERPVELIPGPTWPVVAPSQ